MKLLSVLLILSFALLSVHASEEDDHHRREIVKRASELCHDFREDRLCFAQCKNLHMIQLGHSLGLNNQVCRSECESAANLCSSFGPEALQKAKLGVCSHIEEDDNQNCVSNIPSEIPQQKFLDVSSQCSLIAHNTKIDKRGVLRNVNFHQFPTAKRVHTVCNNLFCRNITETMSFSCVNASNPTPFPPIPCNIAAEYHLFPLCPVRYTVDADCKTLPCCTILNELAVIAFDNQPTPSYNGQDLVMKFVNTKDRIISCSSFTNKGEGNKCTQTFATYGSSDYSVCNSLQDKFNHFSTSSSSSFLSALKSSNDDLSFSLFG